MSRAGRIEAAPLLVVSAGVLAALLGMRTLLTRDLARRNFEFLPDMAYSPAAKSQTPCDVFADGLTDQGLVPGVVVRDTTPFRYGATPEEAKRAGEELVNPFAADDAAALARGAEVFRVYCAVCHGAGGDGDGPATKRGMVPPPSFKVVRAMTIKDGEMFHAVTRGQGNMPSYAMLVAPQDRWKAILHVRTLQKGAQ